MGSEWMSGLDLESWLPGDGFRFVQLHSMAKEYGRLPSIRDGFTYDL